MGLKDIFSPLGGLEKLKITAFEDDSYEASTATYVVMYNPTTFSYQVSSDWLPEEGVNPDARQLQFRSSKSDSVTFEFMFDATGASPPGNDVAGDVDLSYLGDENVDRDLISNNRESAIEIISEDKCLPGDDSKHTVCYAYPELCADQLGSVSVQRRGAELNR
jgi:hypothetical protein